MLPVRSSYRLILGVAAIALCVTVSGQGEPVAEILDGGLSGYAALIELASGK